MVDLRSLLGMLDDPDANTAVSVMAELLKHPDELMPLLGEVQESDDPLLRKRVQQLESILSLRERRKLYLEIVEHEPFNMLDALIALHLLWFERDMPEMLLEMLRTFMNTAANNNITNLKELGVFMALNGFALPPEEERFDPENYCIGPIFEDRLGSDIMLCTLALLAGLDSGLQLCLVRISGRFAVTNGAGEMISPANDWRIERTGELAESNFWSDPRSVFKYASQMLFLYAASSDNFRCMHTIAHALCGSDGMEALDFLPYPYNGKDLSETIKK